MCAVTINSLWNFGRTGGRLNDPRDLADYTVFASLRYSINVGHGA